MSGLESGKKYSFRGTFGQVEKKHAEAGSTLPLEELERLLTEIGASKDAR
jgi:hypothetical protein